MADRIFVDRGDEKVDDGQTPDILQGFLAICNVVRCENFLPCVSYFLQQFTLYTPGFSHTRIVTFRKETNTHLFSKEATITTSTLEKPRISSKRSLSAE